MQISFTALYPYYTQIDKFIFLSLQIRKIDLLLEIDKIGVGNR